MGVDYPGRVKYAVQFAFAAAGALAPLGKTRRIGQVILGGTTPFFESTTLKKCNALVDNNDRSTDTTHFFCDTTPESHFSGLILQEKFEICIKKR